MKQKIDLTSSYIRTNGIKLANAIYKIAEDVDFNGQQIQMPANCVLSFEGGSIANKRQPIVCIYKIYNAIGW